MTFVQIRNLVREFLNDPAPGFYSENLISESCRASYARIGKILVNVQTKRHNLVFLTIDTVVNQKSYNIPEDLFAVQRVEIVNASNLDEIENILEPLPFPSGKFKHYDQSTLFSFAKAGKPTHYMRRLNQIDLHPTPDAVYKLKLWYDFIYSLLSGDDDIPLVDVDFHYHLAEYAAYLVSRTNPNEVRNDLLANYMESETLLISTIGSLGEDIETETPVGMFGI